MTTVTAPRTHVWYSLDDGSWFCTHCCCASADCRGANNQPPAPRVLASTALGDVVECDGIVYLLTQCCGASAKGSANVPSGVVCRACYRELDQSAGWAALASDVDGAGESQMAAMLRPSVGQYYSFVVAHAIFTSARNTAQKGA